MKKQIWMTCALSALLVVAMGSIADAQPGQGGRGGRGGRGGGFRGMGGRSISSAEMLMREDVQQELGLGDEQLEELGTLRDELRQEFRELFSGMRGIAREDRDEKIKEIREKIADIRKKAEKKVDEVLLPSQRTRLKQITLQAQMRSNGTSASLASDKLAEALGLSEEQKKQLKEKAEKVQKELREKIRKLQEEAREDLLSVLTPEQKAKLKELTGEPYKGLDRGNRGRRGRGGRGGQGGRGSN